MAAGNTLKILVTFFLRSRVFADKEAMMAGAMEMAAEVAGRSPVAVQGTKINLVYSRDHSVAEGLDYMVALTAEKPPNDRNTESQLCFRRPGT